MLQVGVLVLPGFTIPIAPSMKHGNKWVIIIHASVGLLALLGFTTPIAPPREHRTDESL